MVPFTIIHFLKIPLHRYTVTNKTGMREASPNIPHSRWLVLIPALKGACPFCYYRLYRTLRYPKLLRRLPHRRILINNIIGNLDCPLFDIFFHGSSLKSFFTSY